MIRKAPQALGRGRTKPRIVMLLDSMRLTFQGRLAEAASSQGAVGAVPVLAAVERPGRA